MGEVYAAHDPELDRKIAIKIMRADALRGRRRGGAADARGASDRAAVASEPGDRVRRRHLRRARLRGDGVDRRRHGRGLVGSAAATARRDPPCLRPGGARAGRRAPRRDHPPRLQTAERHGHRATALCASWTSVSPPSARPCSGRTPHASRASDRFSAPRCTCRRSSCAGSPSIARADQFSFCVALTKRSTASARSRAKTSRSSARRCWRGGRARSLRRAASPRVCAPFCCEACRSSRGGASPTWKRC